MESAHGGLVPLVLADNVGEVRLAPAHQDPQLRDDLEVQGVLTALDALQVLDLGRRAGAQLFHALQGLTLAEEYQNGVLRRQQVDALETGADVVVAVHQKNHFHGICSFFPRILSQQGDLSRSV